MRVIVLGCGGSAGVPMIGGADGRGDWGACDPAEPRNVRTRSAIVIEIPQRQQAGKRAAGGPVRLLVDAGTDLRRQLIDCAVPAIDAVLLTHAHADHISGLDDVRGLNRIVDRPLDCHALPETLADLAGRFDYAFRPWQPPGFYRPVLHARPVEPPSVLALGDARIELFEQAHGRIRTLGLRVGRFAYCTDVVSLDETAFGILDGIDTWLVDSFQRAPHPSHAHPELVHSWSTRLGVRRTVITHMGTDLDWAWMQANLPDGLEPAFDGMVLDFGT